MADGFTSPNPADDGNGDEGNDSDDVQDDDPWADVAGEDELKRRAQTNYDPDDDGSDGEQMSVDDLVDDDDGDDGDDGDESKEPDIKERANELLREATISLAEHGDVDGADPLEVCCDSVQEALENIDLDDDTAVRNFGNLLDVLEKRIDTVEENAAEPDTQPEHPRPDPVDNDEPGVVPEFTEVPDGIEIMSDDVSCADCAHRSVCVILSSFAPKLADENWDAGLEDEGSPIDPLDMAKICDSYEPEDDDAPKQVVDQT